MRLFKRKINLLSAIAKGPLLALATMRIFILFKQPFLILNCYLKSCSPASKILRMRNGYTISLSDHPHDVLTNFVVFGKKDYGKIRTDSIVIDVGANIGTFALYAVIKGAKKIYSIEPNSKSFDALNKNIANNKLQGRVIPFKAAISDTDGEQVLIPIESSPYNSIINNKGNNTNFETAETLSLATLCKNENITHIDLLKIDCEGAEFKIIPGLTTDLMSMIREIKVEYLGEDASIILNHLKQNSFEVKKHEKDARFSSGMIWALRTN